MEIPPEKTPGPLRTLGTGVGWAIILIPLMPIIIPLIIFYYLGQMVQIVAKGGFDGRGK